MLSLPFKLRVLVLYITSEIGNLCKICNILLTSAFTVHLLKMDMSRRWKTAAFLSHDPFLDAFMLHCSSGEDLVRKCKKTHS